MHVEAGYRTNRVHRKRIETCQGIESAKIVAADINPRQVGDLGRLELTPIGDLSVAVRNPQ